MLTGALGNVAVEALPRVPGASVCPRKSCPPTGHASNLPGYGEVIIFLSLLCTRFLTDTKGPPKQNDGPTSYECSYVLRILLALARASLPGPWALLCGGEDRTLSLLLPAWPPPLTISRGDLIWPGFNFALGEMVLLSSSPFGLRVATDTNYFESQ